MYLRDRLAQGVGLPPSCEAGVGCQPHACQIRAYFGLPGTGPLYAARLHTAYVPDLDQEPDCHFPATDLEGGDVKTNPQRLDFRGALS
jgi:hypothetical protein